MTLNVSGDVHTSSSMDKKITCKDICFALKCNINFSMFFSMSQWHLYKLHLSIPYKQFNNIFPLLVWIRLWKRLENDANNQNDYFYFLPISFWSSILWLKSYQNTMKQYSRKYLIKYSSSRLCNWYFLRFTKMIHRMCVGDNNKKKLLAWT